MLQYIGHPTEIMNDVNEKSPFVVFVFVQICDHLILNTIELDLILPFFFVLQFRITAKLRVTIYHNLAVPSQKRGHFAPENIIFIFYFCQVNLKIFFDLGLDLQIIKAAYKTNYPC